MERLAQCFDGRKDAIAQLFLDQIPKLFAGIVLGAVGRQIDDAHVGRQSGIAVTEMEAGLVTHENINAAGILRRKIL